MRALADVEAGKGAAPCAIRCLAGPLLVLGASPVFSVLLSDALASSIGCRRHRDVRTLAGGAVGLLGPLLAAIALRGLGEIGERIAC
jgi:hypothetical protein